jgi:hypothetical protein
MAWVWDGDGGVRLMRLLRSLMRWKWAGASHSKNRDMDYVIMRMIKRDRMFCMGLEIRIGSLGMFIKTVFLSSEYAFALARTKSM